MNFLRGALAVMFALGSTGGHSQPAQFDPQQRQAIEGIIREYLLENPEVLQEAIGEPERRQQEAQRAAQAAVLRNEREKLINSPEDYVIGNPSGDVTLVEFFDYNCPYCRKAEADIDVLIKKDPNLRVVLKDFPVLGPDSIEASRLAVAAKRQLSPDRLLAFHGKLMEIRGRADGERALAVAMEFGLDLARLQKDIQGGTVTAVLQANAALGDELGITGTPVFILNQDIIAGAVGIEPLREAIANIRQCGKGTCG